MVAQILWVRKGFPIRGQLLHYPDFMLRGLCHDQDLFILQTSLIILDYFRLLQVFQGAGVHPTYEGPRLSSMAEEVLYVIIALLTEMGSPTSPFGARSSMHLQLDCALTPTA